MQSCEGIPLQLIKSQKTADAMWKKLKNKYEPKNITSLMKLEGDFHKCRMENNYEDPLVWLSRLELIKAQIEEHPDGEEVKESKMIAHIMTTLPKNLYETEIKNIQKGELKKYDDICTALRDQYNDFIMPKIKEYQRKKGKKAGDDIALNAEGRKGYKKFKGKCRNCGKQGHKAADCWYNKNQDGDNKGGNENKGNGGDDGGFNGYCFVCGKKGHRASDCRQKRGGNDYEEQGHFVGYVGEASSTVCIECKEEATGQYNAYDKLDSFFDRFGGEDSNSLDESEGFKIVKEENDDAMPEWANAEFNGEFVFKEELDVVGDTVEGPNVSESIEESTMVTVGIRQEALLVRDEVLNRDKDEWTYWLVDSGSTTHIDLTTEGMIDVVEMENGEDQVRVGNKKWVEVVARGTRRLLTEDNAIFELENTGVIPIFAKKIISGGRLIEKGNKIIMDGKDSFIENKQGQRLKLMRRPDGMLYLKAKILYGNKREQVNNLEEGTNMKKVKFADGLEIELSKKKGNIIVDELDAKPKSILKSTAASNNTISKKKTMTMDALHVIWAHASEKYIKATAKEFGIKVTGKLSPCFGCAQAKARQKNTSKEAKNPATKPGERFFLDLSGPFAPSIAGSKYWLKMVDEFFEKKFRQIYKDQRSIGRRSSKAPGDVVWKRV
jgi:hypothetical protein